MWCYDSLDNVCEELLWLEPHSHFYLLTTQPCCMSWKNNFSLQLQHAIYMQAALESACFTSSGQLGGLIARAEEFCSSCLSGVSPLNARILLKTSLLTCIYSRPSICKLLLVTCSVELPKQRFFLTRGPYSNNTPSMLEYLRE